MYYIFHDEANKQAMNEFD